MLAIDIDYRFTGKKKSLQKLCNDLNKIIEHEETDAHDINFPNPFYFTPSKLYNDVPSGTIGFSDKPSLKDLRIINNRWTLCLSAAYCPYSYDEDIHALSEMLKKHYPNIDAYNFIYYEAGAEGTFTNDIDSKFFKHKNNTKILPFDVYSLNL